MSDSDRSHGQVVQELEAAHRRIAELEADLDRHKRIEEALERRLSALTQPGMAESGVAFEELFSLRDIQRLQDEFALATGVASIITKPDGTPITAPSCFRRLCNDIIRKTELGLANCMRSDAELGRYLPEGPNIRPCMSGGLWDAGAGVTVDGRHIANWLIGQVRDSAQTEEQIRSYAREIGADEEDAASAFGEVPSMTRERFGHVAQALHTLANHLSEMAWQNVQQARAIVERKRIEAVLKGRDEELRTILDNVPALIYLKDKEGRFRFVNRTWLDAMGLTEQDVLGKLPQDIFPGKVAALLTAEDSEAIGSQVAVQAEQTLDLPGGQRRLLTREVALRDSTGKAYSLCGVATDITQLREAEKHLRMAMASIESSHDYIYWIDEYGRILYVNPAVEQELGYTTEELRSMTVSDIDPNVPPHVWGPDGELVRATKVQGLHKYETQHRHRDGHLITVEVDSDAFEFDGKIYFTCLVRDVSELNRRKEAMIQTEKMISVGGLASGLAHEINNPLGGILQNLQNVKRRLSPDLPANMAQAAKSGCNLESVRDYLQARQVFEFLDAIEDSGRIAARVVSYLMDFSRKDTAQREPADVNALVKSAIGFCLRNKKAELLPGLEDASIIRRLAPDLPLVPCIQSQIELALVNLLKNAAQSLENRPTGSPPLKITVTTSSSAKDVRITVEDNGPGMKPEVLRRAFDPFFTTRPVGKGAGLGLSVAYYIVTNNHGGALKAESTPGAGSRFVIRLPIEPSGKANPFEQDLEQG